MSGSSYTTFSRKDFLVRAGAAAAGVAAAGLPNLTSSSASESGSPVPGKPNIVFVMLDDLGYGDLGSYGSQIISTPNIDRLASDGVRFSAAYSGAPICTPSRAALLTGRYGVRVGMPRVFEPGSHPGLPHSEKTVAQYLREAGYATGIFGKWHLGSDREHSPTRYGFERFFGPLHSNDQHPFELWSDEEVVETEVEQSLLTRRYTAEASGFIRENRDRPFFAYVAHSMPHIPLHTEERFRGVSAAGTYGDVVESVDHYVGELLSVLEDEELLENTLLIVTSDNGPWYTGSTGGLRGRKGETYEGGMRVPFIVHWPAVSPSGALSQSPFGFTDILPTLCAVAGIEPEPGVKLDGEDVSGLLRDEQLAGHGPIHFFAKESLNAVRRDKWKLHLRRVPEGGYSTTQGMPQLFDLTRNPGEDYDLAARHSEVVDELRGLIGYLEEELRATGAQSPGSSAVGLDALKEWWPR